MDNISFNYLSLRQHKVTEENCLYVIEHDKTVEHDEGYSRDGNYRIMFIHFDTDATRLLEIGVEFIKIEGGYWWHVYHANDATPKYQKVFNEEQRS